MAVLLILRARQPVESEANVALDVERRASVLSVVLREAERIVSK
jgi:hypothetical protein